MAADPEISASLSPASAELGESVRLSVQISNVASAPAPRLPAIDGITVRGSSQQMSMSIVNGRSTSSVTHTFVLEPTRAGDFVIPPVRVDVGGQTLTADALRLRVTPPGSRPPAGPGPGVAPGANGDRAEAQPAANQAPASLTLRMPVRDLYAGEVVRGELQLRIREGLRVTEASQPTIQAPAFAVTRKTDRQAEQRTTVIGGERYVVVTFPVALSPVSAGPQRIEARMELGIVVPRRNQGRGGGAFDDPFFDSFFGGLAGEQKKLDVVAPPLEVTVLQLPSEGRPADFSGAIGTFSITASAKPTELAAGDPVTLTTTVSGIGNFDRVALAPLALGADWKSYPENATFTATDDLDLAGRKVFEQAFVPKSVRASALPARSFSYFDPEARRYSTIELQPIALRLSPSATDLGAASRTATKDDGRDGAPRDAFELAPNEIAPGQLERASRPLPLRPWFWAAQLIPLAGLGIAYAWARRRERLLADTGWQRARAARRFIDEQVAAMDQALRSGDRTRFFGAARRAVQQAVAARHERTAEVLTLAEIEACLAADAPSKVLDEIRALFATADAASYARAAGDASEIEPWRRRTAEILSSLESR